MLWESGQAWVLTLQTDYTLGWVSLVVAKIWDPASLLFSLNLSWLRHTLSCSAGRHGYNRTMVLTARPKEYNRPQALTPYICLVTSHTACPSWTSHPSSPFSCLAVLISTITVVIVASDRPLTWTSTPYSQWAPKGTSLSVFSDHSWGFQLRKSGLGEQSKLLHSLGFVSSRGWCKK